MVCAFTRLSASPSEIVPHGGAAPCPTVGVRAGDAADPWPALAVPTTSSCARFAQRLKIGADHEGGLVRPGNTLATCNGGALAHRDHNAPGERCGGPTAPVLLHASILRTASLLCEAKKTAGKPLWCKLTRRFARRCTSQCTSAASLQLCRPRDSPHAVQPRHIEILLLRLP